MARDCFQFFLMVSKKSENKKDILDEIQRIRADGAEAYGFQIDILEDEFKSQENLKEIFQILPICQD